ncbi:MAG TPA: hypothetical protein VHB93_01925 [Candidatus Paceibacterota bacterium]|nr:hypothetical protein [Candidatus Paceibacterota bacterium]
MTQHRQVIIVGPDYGKDTKPENLGYIHWTRIHAQRRQVGRPLNPRWHDVMKSVGKGGYDHHLLISHKTYVLMGVPADKCLPRNVDLTNGVIYKYGIAACRYGDPVAGIIPELSVTLSEEDEHELHEDGYLYGAAIHDRMAALGEHERLWFPIRPKRQQREQFDIYFEPQFPNGVWKPGGIFFFPAKLDGPPPPVVLASAS